MKNMRLKVMGLTFLIATTTIAPIIQASATTLHSETNTSEQYYNYNQELTPQQNQYVPKWVLDLVVGGLKNVIVSIMPI